MDAVNALPVEIQQEARKISLLYTSFSFVDSCDINFRLPHAFWQTKPNHRKNAGNKTLAKTNIGGNAPNSCARLACLTSSDLRPQ